MRKPRSSRRPTARLNKAFHSLRAVIEERDCADNPVWFETRPALEDALLAMFRALVMLEGLETKR